MDKPFDRELSEALYAAELEYRIAELGRETERIARGAGFGFDAETFVVSELVRGSHRNHADPDGLLAYFVDTGLVDRAVAAIDA